MARKQRIDFPGAWHHIFHRGARRAPIFLADNHCTLFLDVVKEMVERFEIEVHGFALLTNHYHLLLRSVLGNLSRSMAYLNSTYTLRVNKLHCWDGPIYRGRFGNQLFMNEAQLKHVLAYIHLNPVRANIINRPDGDWWTSYKPYVGLERKPGWLTCDTILDLHGGMQELAYFTKELHTGVCQWPEDFDINGGLFKPDSHTHPNLAHLSTKRSRFLDPTTVIEKICATTRASRNDLMCIKKGPRANPARRFAVWALRYRTKLINN